MKVNIRDLIPKIKSDYNVSVNEGEIIMAIKRYLPTVYEERYAIYYDMTQEQIDTIIRMLVSNYIY
jgi:hypothetical protein